MRTRVQVLVGVLVALLTLTTSCATAHAAAKSYWGKPAAAVAKDLHCLSFRPTSKQGNIVRIHRSGVCWIDGKYRVNILTFSRRADLRAWQQVARDVLAASYPDGYWARGQGVIMADKDLARRPAAIAARRLHGALVPVAR